MARLAPLFGEVGEFIPAYMKSFQLTIYKGVKLFMEANNIAEGDWSHVLGSSLKKSLYEVLQQFAGVRGTL